MQAATKDRAIPASSIQLPPYAQSPEPIYTASLPAAGNVRLPVVVAVAGLGKSTIWKWCADGRFPKPIKLSPRVSVWPVSELRHWLADPVGWQALNQAQGS